MWIRSYERPTYPLDHLRGFWIRDYNEGDQPEGIWKLQIEIVVEDDQKDQTYILR